MMTVKAIASVSSLQAANNDPRNSPGNFSAIVNVAGVDPANPVTINSTAFNIPGNASAEAINDAIEAQVKADLATTGYVFGPNDRVRVI